MRTIEKQIVLLCGITLRTEVENRKVAAWNAGDDRI